MCVPYPCFYTCPRLLKWIKILNLLALLPSPPYLFGFLTFFLRCLSHEVRVHMTVYVHLNPPTAFQFVYHSFFFLEIYLQTAGKTDSCCVTCFPCTLTHALIINWLTAYMSGYNNNLLLQLLVCHALLFSAWPQCELLKWIWDNTPIPLAGERNPGTEHEGSVFPAEGVSVKHILEQLSTCWRKLCVLQLNYASFGQKLRGRRARRRQLKELDSSPDGEVFPTLAHHHVVFYDTQN